MKLCAQKRKPSHFALRAQICGQSNQRRGKGCKIWYKNGDLQASAGCGSYDACGKLKVDALLRNYCLFV